MDPRASFRYGLSGRASFRPSSAVASRVTRHEQHQKATRQKEEVGPQGQWADFWEAVEGSGGVFF